MYWIYLTLFVFIILTPKVMQQGVFFFSEEDVEALLIFLFGILGFLIYVAKEKALLRVFREKLHLQKQTNIITRDLSDSYSYIGEMNRKFDIVKDLIFGLPRESKRLLENKNPDFYASILGAVRLLAKTDHVSIRFVNCREKEIKKVYESARSESKNFNYFDAPRLLRSHKHFWEENNCIVVRSPRDTPELASFIIFPKAMNRIDDAEVFKILAAQALFLYCVEKRITS